MRILIKEAELQGLLFDCKITNPDACKEVDHTDNPKVSVCSLDGKYNGILCYDEEGNPQILWNLEK